MTAPQDASFLPPLAAFPGGGAGRELPHSIEAEAHLLSCIFLDGAETMARCFLAKIAPAAFYEPAHAVIFRVILDLHARQLPLEVAIVAEELKARDQLAEVGGYERLVGLTAHVPTTAQAGYFIEKVRELWILRELVRFGGDLATAASGYAEADLAGFLTPRVSWLQNALTRVVHGARGGGVTLAQSIEAAAARFESRIAGQEDRSRWVYTGLPYFDAKLKPFGQRPEDHFVLLGGGSSQGKSVLCRQFTGHALRSGQRVLFYALETNRTGFIEGLASTWARVNYDDLPSAPKDIQARYRAAFAELQPLADRQLFVFERDAATELGTVEALVRHVEAWTWQHGRPDLVVIDYIQLLNTEKKRLNIREQILGEVAKQIQQLCRRHEIVVLAAAQLNQSGIRDMREVRRNKETNALIHRLPNEGDLRESQVMFHAADRCLMIYRPPENISGGDQVTDTPPVLEQWVVQIKHRHGPKGFVKCWFHTRHLLFEEFTSAESQRTAVAQAAQTGAVPPGGLKKTDWKKQA